MHQFTRVDFKHFKAFRSFTLHLRHFNMLVGPNNAGKSTILAAFRVLAAALRTGNRLKPQPVTGPLGRTFGYYVDLAGVSVAEENIFYNYDDSSPASVSFHLSNGNDLLLYFPERGSCILVPEAGAPIRGPGQFRHAFDCPIGFVPILGPVEHNERLYEKEAARLALFNYRAARNFRNIWHHYPEHFEEFRTLLRQTWPGMDITEPSVDNTHDKPVLHMFCPEERIPREIFWAGFGFQVWCQMLTHVVQSKDASLFLIDEPDIYLHSDLQRQLLSLLRNLGPDILIATHSAEMIADAEADEIVLIDKRRKGGRRIRQPAEMGAVFSALGSNLNPILTQLAKTRKAVFVEGRDFQTLARFGRRLGCPAVASRAEFAVVPVEGFSPDRIKTLKRGMELTLGGEIDGAAVLDRDFRSDAECAEIASAGEQVCEPFIIHTCKEIENFLLTPSALDRAAATRLADRAKRTGQTFEYTGSVAEALRRFADTQKSYVAAQYLARRKQFERHANPSLDESKVNQLALDEFELEWKDEARRFAIMPGKQALSAVNEYLQREFGVTLTTTAIVDTMRLEEVPEELRALIADLEAFAERPQRSDA